MNDDAKLQELAQRLGARAAERLDVAAVAEKVVARLRVGEQPVPAPSWVSPRWLRIAAALVILIGGVISVARLIPGRRPGVSPAHVAHLVEDDLSDLSTIELRDVLSQFDEIVTTTVSPDSTDLRELDAQQLRQMLRSLEG